LVYLPPARVVSGFVIRIQVSAYLVQGDCGHGYGGD